MDRRFRGMTKWGPGLKANGANVSAGRAILGLVRSRSTFIFFRFVDFFFLFVFSSIFFFFFVLVKIRTRREKKIVSRARMRWNWWKLKKFMADKLSKLGDKFCDWRGSREWSRARHWRTASLEMIWTVGDKKTKKKIYKKTFIIGVNYFALRNWYDSSSISISLEFFIREARAFTDFRSIRAAQARH